MMVSLQQRVLMVSAWNVVVAVEQRGGDADGSEDVDSRESGE